MQELVGHSSCTVTADICTNINMDSKREAAEALARSMAAFTAATENPEMPE